MNQPDPISTPVALVEDASRLVAGQVLSEQTVLLQVIARAAQDPSIDLDRMERLLVMHERLNARRAEREFIEAMARFKANPPRIIKAKRVFFPHKDGGGSTDYMHATLGQVCDAAITGLAAVGISHRWDLERKEGRIYVTCVLTHIGGHSTRTTWDGAPDDSGKKNSLQQSASAITYLERYTLLAATGLATEDQDNDGLVADEADTVAVEAPEGFDSWKADMDAVDTESALAGAWKRSSPIFRAYVTLKAQPWWDTRKLAVAGK